MFNSLNNFFPNFLLLLHCCGSSSRADPDPEPDPDPTFQFDADPDSDPTYNFFPDLDPPMLQNDPLMPCHLDADPDPAFILMRIRIQLSTLLRIRIWTHCIKKLLFLLCLRIARS